jgi:hypothetical protein
MPADSEFERIAAQSARQDFVDYLFLTYRGPAGSDITLHHYGSC